MYALVFAHWSGALIMGRAFLGKQSGMVEKVLPQLGAKEIWVFIEAAKHKMPNVISEGGT